MLVRGHAIVTKILEDIISIRVPNLYKLTLGLPCSILEHSTTSYFDCKIRKLIVAMPVRRIEEVQEIVFEAAPVKVEEIITTQVLQTDDLLFDVI